MRISTGIVLVMLGQGMAGCAGSGSLPVPSAPSLVPQTTPAPQPRPVELAVFTDSTTGFSTSDVYDVQEQIVRFNTADELIFDDRSLHFV